MATQAIVPSQAEGFFIEGDKFRLGGAVGPGDNGGRGPLTAVKWSFQR